MRGCGQIGSGCGLIGKGCGQIGRGRGQIGSGRGRNDKFTITVSTHSISTQELWE